jgi:hypothetical protein
MTSLLVETAITALLSIINLQRKQKRPWTRQETERLILSSQDQTFAAVDFGRTERECTEHLADVMAVIFGGPGENAMRGIRDIVRMRCGKHVREPQITPALTELVLRRFLIDKKGWDDLEIGRKKSEEHFQEVLQWISIFCGCSMSGLFSCAVDAYYSMDKKNI